MWPRPQVLPRPLPMPRPTRLAEGRLPASGLRSLSRIAGFLHDRNHVIHGLHHAARARRIFDLDHVVHATQPQTAYAGLMVGEPAVHAAHQLDLHHFFVGHGLPQDLGDRLAALRSNGLGIVHGTQPLDRGTDHVDRVVGSDALGQNVLNTEHLEDRAHGAARDDSGTLRRRLHEHLRGPVTTVQRILQGASVELDLDHVLARVFHRLLDRHRHLAGLAATEPDTAFAVAHHRQGGETELAPALDDLGDTIDRDQLLEEIISLVLRIEVRHARTPRISARSHARHPPAP
ncbi:conserved hypothetical protein [Thiocapsa sp. KS1]|nr:conserved hypothetical protein [Thiocapsa sp. KS1]